MIPLAGEVSSLLLRLTVHNVYVDAYVLVPITTCLELLNNFYSGGL
jgi:hypothetical protein